MEVGDLGSWGPLPWWGSQSIYSIQSPFFLDHIHTLGGVPRQWGASWSACPVNPLWWVIFTMWKLRSGVTRLTGVIKSLERGELFRQFHLQNRQNTDEINSAGEN